jgi:pyridoxine kinase
MSTPTKNLKVVAINSFAVHGTASLKAITNILGSRVLPVPSIILNGLTNMPGVTKFPSPLPDLLRGTFELVKHRKQEVILYIGYLGSAEQIDLIIQLIDEFEEYIRFIITDPISGDHGKAYVPKEIISGWPKLIEKSDIVFPNLTEVKLLSGFNGDEEGDDALFIDKFHEKYPATDLVVTSIRKGNKEIGIQYYQKNKSFSYYHPVLPRNFGGSGDTFVALFIYFHFYQQLSEEKSLSMAADKVYDFIQKSVEANADELLLES